ncbi:DUF4919 domain-containing protein [Niabella insulamsoli]|uniref:DUF4919 domain-containing protein n=1 Tax=Niabella insulamsoli TaxID=3144874 RepID=UPI0031FBDE6B
MRTTAFIILLSLTGIICRAQQHPTALDLTAIKKAVNDSVSATGYKALLKKFNQAPQYLYPFEGAIIYYGKLFLKERNAVSSLAGHKKFEKLFAQKNFAELIKEGEPLLSQDPASLKLLIALAASYIQTGDSTMAYLTRSKINLLMPAILMHGNGVSDSTTIKVTDVADEYVIMDLLRLRGNNRKTTKTEYSFIDMWTLQKSKRVEQEAIYFEVYYPF